MVASEELEETSQRVGEIRGWDFSSVEMPKEDPPWQYDDVVRQYLHRDSVVADIGTGGGEVFSSFAADLRCGYGLDKSLKRLAVAQDNLQKDGIGNLGYVMMDAKSLAFGDMSLDVVLAKYADFDPAEVLRVLRPGGIFITQQMGDNDMSNIFEAFGGSTFGDYWRARFRASGEVYRTAEECGRVLQALGAEIVRYDEYDVRQYFQDLDSLVFYLKATPLPEPFDPSKHEPAITRLEQRYGSERGIETNSHRQLLIARRP